MHKTVEEIIELPASEIVGWMEYFETYPFTQDREDARTALLAVTIWNTAGRTVKDNHLKPLEYFMPNFLNDTESTQRTLEQQAEADRAFGEKLMQMQAIARTN